METLIKRWQGFTDERTGSLVPQSSLFAALFSLLGTQFCQDVLVQRQIRGIFNENYW